MALNHGTIQLKTPMQKVTKNDEEKANEDGEELDL
jgi:hypothetical protein